jgi:GIY-YIG catalytic domain
MEEEKRFTGYIYKISSPHTDKVYIGSTKETLKRRLQQHNSSYIRYLNKKTTNYVSSFEILKEGDVLILEIERLENITIDELRLRETYLIRNTADTVNKVNPRITKHERSEYKTQYSIENKEHIAEYQKQYQVNHTEEKKKISKKYYDKNKVKTSEQDKIKTNCVCGSIFRECSIARHNKSKKHLSYIQNLTPPVINITIQNLTINNK